MKGRTIHYMPEELAWIEARKEMPRAELYALFCAFWERKDVTFTAFKGLCKRKGWMTGRTGCFEKGLVPHNKGMPHDHPASRATRFKKGAVPANITPMWTERMTRDGYVEMKVPERNPHTGHKSRYKMKQVWLWEQTHGPIPKDCVLKCLDGDRTNCDPSNWEVLPRSVLPRLSGRHGIAYDQAPAEIKPTLLAIAKLEQRARERRDGNP